ncbi:ATP-binding protein, partial [Planococcus sp. SIMBA_160]
ETATALPDLLRKAEQKSWTYLEFLERLTASELEKREKKSIEKRLNWARFPNHRPLDLFRIEEQEAITERQLKQLLE